MAIFQVEAKEISARIYHGVQEERHLVRSLPKKTRDANKVLRVIASSYSETIDVFQAQIN
jgi:hypothetical protein